MIQKSHSSFSKQRWVSLTKQREQPNRDHTLKQKCWPAISIYPGWPPLGRLYRLVESDNPHSSIQTSDLQVFGRIHDKLGRPVVLHTCIIHILTSYHCWWFLSGSNNWCYRFALNFIVHPIKKCVSQCFYYIHFSPLMFFYYL